MFPPHNENIGFDPFALSHENSFVVSTTTTNNNVYDPNSNNANTGGQVNAPPPKYEDLSIFPMNLSSQKKTNFKEEPLPPFPGTNTKADE